MRTLPNSISLFVGPVIFAAILASGGLAQADLDEDGIPDAEDPETTVSENRELLAGECTFLDLVITNSSVLTLRGDPGLPAFKGVRINAENVTIDSGSSISADGRGYPQHSGPGTVESGNGGGGYGGKGGAGGYGGGGPTYGSARQPVDPGSGGGELYMNPGAPGGGAIRLVVSNTLTNDGIISANGEDPPDLGGAGSGGSIYVTTNVLSGSGSFTANGGTGGHGGGGGGRIAIYYQASTFAGQAEGTGGTGYANGEDGTVGFFDTVSNDMYVYTVWRFLDSDGNVFNYNNVTFENAQILFETNTSLTAATLTLTDSSITTVPGWKLELDVGDLTLDATSSISADGKGYGNRSGPGAVDGNGGGGYGGSGGAGAFSGGGSTYGSAVAPVDLGSGGGEAYNNPGAPGGGTIRLVVSDTMANDGIISANGADPAGSGGAGSGGSIHVTTHVLSGSGSLTANGGSADPGGGGGGGRIAIYYQTSSFTGAAEAKGGSSPYGNGEEGTVGFFDATNNDMYVYTVWRFLESDGNVFNYNNVTFENAQILYENNTSLAAATLTLNNTSITTVPGWKLALDVGDVTVDATSSVSADGKGHGGHSGPGTAESGNGGGGYGGNGGTGGYGGSGSPYGSAVEPEDLGSGGGEAYMNPGAPGGGAIRLVASGTLTNDGIISANGADPAGTGGAGSGGSIYVTTNGLSGSGSFTANGGTGGHGGGGGGGRIAIYYQTSSFTGAAEAKGGTGYSDGDDGTVGLFDALKSEFHAGHSWCFQQNQSPFDFDEITLSNGSQTTCEDNVIITTNVLSVGGSSTLSILGKETVINAEGVTVTGSSAITGNLHLTARDLTVDSTSSLSADGKGYGSRSGPGAGSWGGAAGGGAGYGGRGGAGAGGIGGPTYGSAIEPVDMGSGGGDTWGNPGASGGGVIRLVVSNTLANDGIISANGADPTGGSGGGSGGSIYVTTDILSGSGSFAANGGNADPGSGGGGGGGRIAVYYQTSSFTGTAEAKGGTGFGAGEDATPIVSSDVPSTATRLTETNSTESILSETIFSHTVTLIDVAVEGDLEGILSFTDLEMVSIGTGPFAEKGFLRGAWSTTLDGLPYEGSLKGMFFWVPEEKKVYLKCTTSGEITGMIEGRLSEAPENGDPYDRSFKADWEITRLSEEVISTALSLTGTLSYEEVIAGIGTQIYALQTFVQGSSVGHYTGPLNTVLTHLRVDDAGSPYNGQGFSVLSYTSDFGSGEGWTYDERVAPGSVELSGLFTSPLSGIVSANLCYEAAGRTLAVSIERTDYGLPPMPRLNLAVWGPTRISPGQTFDYIVEYRNEGPRTAENVELVDKLPNVVEYMSNTGGASFNPESREVIWRMGEIPAQGKGYVTATSRAVWGLPQGMSLTNFAFMQDPLEIPVDPTVTITSEILEATENSLRVTAYVSGVSGSGAIELDMTIADATQEIEPVVDVVDSLQDVEVVSEYTFTGSLKKANTTLKWAKGGYQTCAKTADVRDDVRAAKNNTDFLDWLLENNLISPEKYQTLKRRAESRPVLGIIKGVVEKAPIMGDLYGDAVDGAKDVGWETGVSKSVQEQIVDNMITDPSYQPPFDIWPPSYGDIYDHYRDSTSPGSDSTGSEIVPARDPNIKYGPAGIVSAGQKLDYRVEFENEGEGIAFGVYFTDTLDEDLDDSTLEIGSVLSVSDGSVIGPPGTYDPETRTVTWFVGEVGPHERGYADLSVNVRSDAPEGTVIINFGIVYFPSVPEVTRTNGIISIVPYPEGAVSALSKTGNSLTIEWEPFGGGQYTVQTTTDLASGVWTDAPGEWPTEARWYATDVIGIKQVFIRVKAGGSSP